MLRVPDAPVAQVGALRLGPARVGATAERLGHQAVVGAVQHDDRKLLARRRGAGLFDAGAHGAAGVGPKRAQAQVVAEGGVGCRGQFSHQAHARARRDAAGVGPPGGAFGRRRRAWLAIGAQGGEGKATGHVGHAGARVGRGVGRVHRAPQVEIAADHAGGDAGVGPAAVEQVLAGLFGLGLRVAGVKQAAGLEHAAA